MRNTRLVLALALLASPIAAQQPAPTTPTTASAPRVVRVTGTGQVSVAPDVANVSYSIVTDGATTASTVSLIEANKRRAAPTVAYLKEVVGENGTVRATPTLQRVEEYDQALRKTVLKGYRVVTSIQVELCGEANIEQNLSKLFDATKIKADETGSLQMSLSQQTRKTAMLQAYKAAVQDGVDTATAQLEPGEQLGEAISRGESAEVPAPRYEMARAMADSRGGSSVGQMVVETGKIQVNAVINFLFEVQGKATRLLSGGGA